MVNINDEYEIGFIVSNVRFTLTCNEKLSLPKNQILYEKNLRALHYRTSSAV